MRWHTSRYSVSACLILSWCCEAPISLPCPFNRLIPLALNLLIAPVLVQPLDALRLLLAEVRRLGVETEEEGVIEYQVPPPAARWRCTRSLDASACQKDVSTCAQSSS